MVVTPAPTLIELFQSEIHRLWQILIKQMANTNGIPSKYIPE
jgi:hypothetical protein